VVETLPVEADEDVKFTLLAAVNLKEPEEKLEEDKKFVIVNLKEPEEKLEEDKKFAIY
jgi:hypothetical protein